MKVLMSAYACEPGRGSEAGVGWNWAVQAARYHEVWVVTGPGARRQIEQELEHRPRPGLHVVHHDVPKWKPEWRSGYLRHNLYYRAWQLTAIPLARRLHRQIGFDVGHQVTYVSFRHPSFLAWLGIPYVWGPFGGGELAPLRFHRVYGLGGTMRELLRTLSVLLARADPMVRLTARRACAVLAVTPQTRSVLPKDVQSKTRIVPATGIATSATTERAIGTACREQLRLLFVGQLLYWKGPELAIRALAQVHRHHPRINATLTVIGEGPSRSTLERLSFELGVPEIVTFTGQLPPCQVQAVYREHDVLVFPSFTDSGGFVVLEAMAAGLPVVCLDLAGPALMVNGGTGIRVPASSPEQVISDITSAIVTLASDPALRRRMGDAARERVLRQYTWDTRGGFLDKLYTGLIPQR